MAQLVKQSGINLSTKLRRCLVKELNNLLRHQQGCTMAFNRFRRQKHDLSKHIADFVRVGECCEGLNRKLKKNGFEVLD